MKKTTTSKRGTENVLGYQAWLAESSTGYNLFMENRTVDPPHRTLLTKDSPKRKEMSKKRR